MRSLFLFLPIMLFSALVHAAAEPDKRLWAEMEDLKRIVATNNKIIAEAIESLNQLKSELQVLGGDVGASKHFVEDQKKQVETMIREFDYRITGLEEQMAVQSQQLGEFLSGGPSNPTTATKGSPEEMTDYDRALGAINLKDYKNAVELFGQFLKKYPKSGLLDNAKYWLGEAYFALREFPKAVLAFQKLNTEHPSSPKVPGALLKQGFALYELKSYQEAKAFLQKLLSKYPSSKEATMAQERLQKIDDVLAANPAR